MIQTAHGQALLCPWCGREAHIPAGAELPPLDVSACGGCGGAVQVPLNVKSATWLERVEDESKLPLRSVNKIHEVRGQLRNRGMAH